MPRDSKSRPPSESTSNYERRITKAKEARQAADVVIDLLETDTLPTFIKVAISDALAEAAEIKGTQDLYRKRKKGKTTVIEFDPCVLAMLLCVSNDLFRVLWSEKEVRTKETPRRKEKSQFNKLKEQLERLEYSSENEGERFRLETMIAREEREAAREEWPEIIGEEL